MPPDAEAIAVSHPEKVLFPADGITKGEMAAYYRLVAPLMLPHIARRPITMERFHRGIGEAGFYQKSVTTGFPAWLERTTVRKKGGEVHHPLVVDAAGLLWLANMNCVTPHVWTARDPDLLHPDLLLFDLDPSDQDDDALRAAALLVRDALDRLGLRSFVKTSGSKGFHIVVAVDRAADYGECAHFAHTFGRALVERYPDTFTQQFYKADRGDRILLDTGTNEYHKTYAAPYAIRARDGAPVSAPCRWEEIERGIVGPRTFTLRAMADRIDEVGDLWHDLHSEPHPLPPLTSLG